MSISVNSLALRNVAFIGAIAGGATCAAFAVLRFAGNRVVQQPTFRFLPHLPSDSGDSR